MKAEDLFKKSVDDIDIKDALNNYTASLLGSSQRDKEKTVEMVDNENPSQDDMMKGQSTQDGADSSSIKGVATKRI